jgi:hydrogenase expression/formation protein HypE
MPGIKMKTSDLKPDFSKFSCPLPLIHKGQIVLGHGSGGRMTKDLIESIFYRYFDNPYLRKGNDFAEFNNLDQKANMKWVVSTDAHIVKPIFFPGGDIGRLAISGTVNDISVSGGIPKFITASFILEEGLQLRDLEKIAISMSITAKEAGVEIIAGDTKVAEKGSADKVFISTTGIGILNQNTVIRGDQAKAGDSVIISGTIGDHGIAVLAARNELGFRTKVESDVAPLNILIQNVLKQNIEVHVMRDPTRGGVATTLNEIALQSKVTITLDETSIPIKQEVRSACEMLGFDPLYIANEGKVIIISPIIHAEDIIQILQDHPLGKDAKIIGEVSKADSTPRVIMKTQIGGTRIVDMLSGEMLPRIC